MHTGLGSTQDILLCSPKPVGSEEIIDIGKGNRGQILEGADSLVPVLSQLARSFQEVDGIGCPEEILFEITQRQILTGNNPPFTPGKTSRGIGTGSVSIYLSRKV